MQCVGGRPQAIALCLSLLYAQFWGQVRLVLIECLGVDTAEPPGNPLIALLVSPRVNILPDTINCNVTPRKMLGPGSTPTLGDCQSESVTTTSEFWKEGQYRTLLEYPDHPDQPDHPYPDPEPEPEPQPSLSHPHGIVVS